MTKKLMEEALTYASLGWRVVPLYGLRRNRSCGCSQAEECSSPGKHPRIAKWQEQATTDEDTIRKWFARSDSNLGVCLGPESGIVDFEYDGPDGQRAIKELFGGSIPDTPRYQSHKGVHYLFKYRDDLPKKAHIPFGTWDLKIGYGGGTQSVFPPSKHAKSPNGYRWLLSPQECQLAEISDEVVEKLKKAKKHEANGSLTEESRNIETASLAGTAFRKAPNIYSEEDTAAAMAAVLAVNEHFRKGKLSDKEIRKTLLSVLLREQQARGGKQALDVMTTEELLADDEEQTYFVDGILAEGQPAILGGPPKSMKTLLLYDLGVSVATGTPFLDYFDVPTPRPTLILSGESGAKVTRKAVMQLAEVRGIDSKMENLYWSFRIPSISQDGHRASIADVIREREIKLLAIDPAYLSLLRGSTASASNVMEMGPLLLQLTELGNELGCTILLAHHSVKLKGKTALRPLELVDLSMAGFAEWARQWILVSRAKAYDHGSGLHQLYLSVGGSAGHSGMYRIHIDEGQPTDQLIGRRWDVRVSDSTEGDDDVRADYEKHGDSILRALDIHETRTRGQLGAELQIRNATLSAMLHYMADLGDIIRDHARIDGRRQIIYRLGERGRVSRMWS